MSNSRIRGAVYSITFALCIIAPILFFLLTGDKEFSEEENRYLQQAPDITVESVLSGKYQTSLEEYLADQFPGRNTFMSLTTLAKLATGHRDIGGVYIASDGFLLDVHTETDFDYDGFRRNMKYISAFCESNPGVETAVVLVPAAASVLNDKLPSFASYYDAKNVLETARSEITAANARIPDLYPVLATSDKSNYYYRTDHHWTVFGAKAAYDCIMQDSGKYSGAPSLVSDSFLGSTYSKTLYPFANPDQIYLFPVSDNVKATADGESIDVYDMSALDRKDKYTVFFGGNHGIVTMTNGSAAGKTAVIVKDSFANCFAPLLSEDYGTVIMIDPRYYDGSLQAVIDEYSPNDLFFLFEMSEIASQRDLVKIIADM